MLKLIKTVHTIIYAIMATAIFYILYCGITKTFNAILVYSIIIVLAEGLIFIGNGRKCPLTTLAQKYGDPKGYVGDTFFPESWTRYTFSFFTAVFVIGLILVLANYLKFR